MRTIDVISGPIAEPITLNDAKLQLGFGPMQDSDRAASQVLNDKLRGFIAAAREYCEGFCRRVFITQTWQYQLDDLIPELLLPKPPFQSIVFFTYVDTFGATQTLTQDTSYGTNPAAPFYGYQLQRGSGMQPARLVPPWARPWAPQLRVPANTIVRFRCGYGGPITCSMTAGAKLLTVTGGAPLTFDLDDAPLLPAETGLPIFVSGAGAASGFSPINGQMVSGGLFSNIASVNPTNGQATLAAAATSTVTNVPGWAGRPIPARITAAIRLLVEYFYENGAASDSDMPRIVERLLRPYRNDVA